MLNFFVNYDSEGAFYSLTKGGYIALAVALVLIMVLAAFLFDRKNAKYSAKQLVFSAVAIALAFALSYVKIYNMPWGGSVTLCSMLFVCLVGYFYGPKMGLIAGLSYGMLQLIQDGGSYMLSPFQVGYDYIFAFMALGVSGFFYKKKNGLIIGYIVAALARGVFHTIGGYIYWMDYMPDSFPQTLSAIYPIVYNYAYILLEMVGTVIILLIPPVNKALKKVRDMAN